MCHIILTCLKLSFLLKLTVLIVDGEFVGSAEFYKLENGNHAEEQLHASESTISGAIETSSLQPTPTVAEIATIPAASHKVVKTVTATRIGTTRYFHVGPTAEILTVPLYPTPMTSTSGSIVSNKNELPKLSSSSTEIPPSAESSLTEISGEENEDLNTDEKFSDSVEAEAEQSPAIPSTETLGSKEAVSEIKASLEMNPQFTNSSHESSELQTPNYSMIMRDESEDELNGSSDNEVHVENSLETTEASSGSASAETSPTTPTNLLPKRDGPSPPKEKVKGSVRISGEELPSPDALVGFEDTPQGLENEFSEALKPQDAGFGPKRRRMRPGPGSRRKVRKRVRKVNPNNSTQSSDDWKLNAMENTTVSPRMNRRYRSTTTAPPSLIFPDPSPSTIISDASNNAKIVIKNEPSPMILQNDLIKPGPQIERPLNIFTERINTYFPPSQGHSTPNPLNPNSEKKLNSNGTKEPGEWLQASNSRQHSVHADQGTEIFGKGRDTWEKNYMNLQQNSFYRSSPEVISGEETLASINRNKGDNHRRDPAQSAQSVTHSEGSQQSVLVMDADNHNDVHHQHNSFPEHNDGVFGLREDNTSDEPNEVKVNIIEVTTVEPESVLIRHSSPHLEYPTGNNRNGESQPSEEMEIIPVAVQEANYFGPPQMSSPENENFLDNPQQGHGHFEGTHYDRTKHEVTELEPDHYSSEVLYDSPKSNGPIKDVRINRPLTHGQNQNPQIGNRQRGLTQPQPITNQIHPFESHEFLGFGGEKHFNPDKVRKGLNPGNIPTTGQEIGQPPIQNFPNPFQVKPNDNFEAPGGNQNRISPNSHPFHYQLLNPQSTKFGSRQEEGQPHQSRPFIPSLQQIQSVNEQQLRGRNIIKNLSKLGPMGNHDGSPFETKHPGTSYQELEKAFFNNMVNSANSSPRRGPPADFPPHHPQHYPPFFSNPKSEAVKSGDFSKAHQSFPGSSPHMTLPMPGLVSIPTPPPESHALNSVYSNRHYPPHTHSMSVRPDYEPANPPLMKGHPLQYHFDPFIQNAGDFPDEKRQKSRGKIKSLSKFKHSPPSYDSPKRNPPRKTYIASQPPSNAYNTDADDYPPPSKKKNRKRKQRNRFPKVIEAAASIVKGFRSSEERPQSYNGNMPNRLTPAELHSIHHGESREVRQQAKPFKETQHKNEPPPDGSIFSESAYLLMFPQMVPQSAMLPAKPFINGKQIPVLSASDPGMVEKALAKAASPGYHSAKVHPREQMLQVLASNHYEMEMEKYMEKKRQPPLPIHTPYGLLVPMGPPSGGVPQHQLEAESSNHHSDRTVSPATKKTKFPLDLSMDELDLNLDDFSGDEDVEVINYPAQFLGVVEHDLHYQGHEGSFSEHKPIKASLQAKAYTPPKTSSKGSKRTDGELKNLVKALLKEHLEEMLADVAEEEKGKKMETGKAKKNPSMQMSSSLTSYNFLPPPPPLAQILRPRNQPLPPPPPEPPAGFLQSIKRFFSFGRKSEPAQSLNPVRTPQASARTNDTSDFGWTHGNERLGGLVGILKTQSGAENEIRRGAKKRSRIEESDEENEGWTGKQNQESGERRPLEKLLKLLFRKARKKLAPNLISGNSEEAAKKTTRKPLFFPRRPLPFVPSRSMEEMEWTPVPFHPYRREQKSREAEDQIQSETKSSGVHLEKSPPPPRINEIQNESILDFDAYTEILRNNAKMKYLHQKERELEAQFEKELRRKRPKENSASE